MLRNKFNNIYIALSAITLWIVYACMYTALKKSPETTTLAGYIALIGETGLDTLAAVLTFKLWRKTEEPYIKNVYLIFFIAFVAAIFADSIYNIVLNLFQFQYINPIIVSLFDIPFALFLLFQLVAWSLILFANKEVSEKANKSSYIPYVIVSLLMFVMFMFGIQWRIEYFSLLGLFQSVDTVLEVLGFALATICLARARTHLIRFTAIGYLLIVSSDFIIRYHVVSGIVPYLSPLEATWVLGLLLMCLGFFLSRDNKATQLLKLSPINSLQSQIAIWLLILWLVSAFLFTGSYYLFSPNTGHYLNHITKNFLSMLVPFSVLAIISSSYISTRISSPLSRLEGIINSFIGSDAQQIPKIEKDNNFIYEFGTLEKFVFDAFLLYEKKHFLEMEFAKTATQVAHDIKSPLVALDNLSRDLPKISDEQRSIILLSINRISEIAEGLLVKHRILNKPEQVDSLPHGNVEMMLPILMEMVSEKREQFKDNNIKIKLMADKSTENTFCLIHAANFKRVISNLINNAVESIGDVGDVSIILKKEFNNLIIEINDTGCGMPQEILNQLRSVVSYNKKSGNGLGLQHAIKCIKEWNGRYIIESKDNVGTSFSIVLKICDPPAWMLDDLYITEDNLVVIVDDDPSIYDIWKEKLSKYPHLLPDDKIKYLNSPEALREYVNSYDGLKDDILFLIDYYYSNSSVNGLDIMSELSLSKNAVLVTNQYPNKNMRSMLSTLNNKFLFKENIRQVPAHHVFRQPDLILLDDKKMITKMWSSEADKNDKKIISFNKKEILMKYIDLFDTSIKIYLDADLDGENGLDVAEELYQKGFFNLYLTTGYDKSKFCNSTYIKGIIGKEPPFSKRPVQGCIQ